MLPGVKMKWPCWGQQRRLRAYHAGMLSEAQRDAVDMHLMQCSTCARRLKDWQAVERLLEEVRSDPPALSKEKTQALFENALWEVGVYGSSATKCGGRKIPALAMIALACLLALLLSYQSGLEPTSRRQEVACFMPQATVPLAEQVIPPIPEMFLFNNFNNVTHAPSTKASRGKRRPLRRLVARRQMHTHRWHRVSREEPEFLVVRTEEGVVRTEECSIPAHDQGEDVPQPETPERANPTPDIAVPMLVTHCGPEVPGSARVVAVHPSSEGDTRLECLEARTPTGEMISQLQLSFVASTVVSSTVRPAQMRLQAICDVAISSQEEPGILK